MAKQIINIGASEQAGDGESLRSAFDKINDNFDELYIKDTTDFDGEFSSLAGTPTTLAGYGITDAATTAQGALAATAVQPQTSLSGYGITDAYTKAEVDSEISTATIQSGSTQSIDIVAADSTVLVDSVNGTLNATTLTGALPAIDGSALTGVASAFSDLTGTPTTLAGYGITDAATLNNMAPTGAVDFTGATSVDFTGATITGTSFLTSVPAQSFASLTGKPTTLAGYGITDALELGTSGTTALAGDTSIPSALTDLGITDGTANQVLTTDGSGNFTFANQSGGGSSYADSDVDTHLNTSSATANQILSWNGTDYTWVADQTGGGGGASPFTWTTSGTDNELRTATGWSEGGASYTIRQASINADNLFEVELATFSPTVTATGQTNLYWDQSATQFNVSVDNPTDFTSKHIEEVASITASTGVHTTLADYTTTGTSATPAGGIDWTQTFTTNATAAIVSNGTGTTGGTAGATITWNDESSSAWTETKTISYSWQNANVTINMSNLSGKNFLEQYNNTSYTVSVSGLQSLGNATSTVTPTGGNVSSTSGSGTFTFTTPVHKDNNDGTRTLAVSTVLSRPIGVTGTAYNITDTASDTAISSNFTYPSFTIFTVDSSTPPTKADIVDGNDFDSAVTELSNQTKQIDTTINNSDSNPRCFWFGVRTNATQPSTFEAGPSNALLSGVSVTTGNTVDLGPDTTPSGYTEEGYTLYGITLQPGNTYVRIS